MPDESSYSSGPHQSVSSPSHVSQHTSSHTIEPRSEHTPAGVRVPPPAAAFPDPSPNRSPNPSLDPFGPPSILRVVIADDNPVVRAGLTVLLGGRDDVEVVAEAADGREALAAAQQTRPDVVLLDVRMPGVDGISALPYLVQVAPVMMLTYSRESEIVREALRLGAGGYLVHGEFTADQLVGAVRDIKEGRAHFTTSAQNALLAHMRGGGAGAAAGAELPEGLGTVYATGIPYTGAGSSRIPGHSSAHDATAHAAREANSGPDVSNSARLPENPSQMQSGMAQYSTDRSRSQRPHNLQDFGLSSREVEVMDLIASGMSNQQIAATCFISEKTVKNHINRIFAKLHSASRSEAIALWLGSARGATGRG
ncbi:response regulator transcription factor [Streptomyces sp. ISL-98]|uniref:response regulator transcription factor n=1 Tax=Streptomyces sp. ISL-98 TaxID=2819192 RepID=UPI001BE991C8|nr:response regulator transcription factor [Streptomyces sp. ISL-98]MBT2506100.1 response regulator transcription factor [Streptomyces sp. ISL-98]